MVKPYSMKPPKQNFGAPSIPTYGNAQMSPIGPSAASKFGMPKMPKMPSMKPSGVPGVSKLSQLGRKSVSRFGA